MTSGSTRARPTSRISGDGLRGVLGDLRAIGLIEERLRLAAPGREHPQPVEREPERRAESQSDPVRRDVVGELAVEPEQIMRDPQAREGDEEPADTDERELDALTSELPPAVLAEGPEPVSDPVDQDRNARRDDVGEERALVHPRLIEHREDQQIEDR